VHKFCTVVALGGCAHLTADKVCPLSLIAVAARSSRFRGDALCKISQSASAETRSILICREECLGRVSHSADWPAAIASLS